MVFGVSVCTAIARQRVRQPNKVALRYRQEDVTYAQLESRVSTAAGLLKSRGVGPSSRVGLAMFDTPDHVVALLAVGRLGATVVPIDFRSNRDLKKQLCGAFGVELMLVSRKTKNAAVEELVFESAAGCGEGLPCEPRDPDAPYLINFSSGSTGLPKPVYMSQQQLFYRAMTWWTNIGITPDLVYLSALPLAYSFGRNYLMFSLIAGHTVVMHDPLFREEELVEFINQQDITLAMFPATIHRRLLSVAGADNLLLPNLRKLISGAAALHPHEKIEIVEKINPNLYEIYGHNGAGLMSILPPSAVRERSATVGVTTSLSEVQIVDDDGNVLPAGSVGRIRSRGPQVAPDKPELAGSSVWPWCFTGEMGVLDDEGYMQLRDREDDMIVTGGFKVFPLEVEQELLQTSGVVEVAVVGLPSQRDGQDVAAFVVSEDKVDVRDLRKTCREKLPAYKVPSRFFFLDSLPRSAASKVLRRELVENVSKYREVESAE